MKNLIERLRIALWFFKNQDEPEVIVNALIEQNRRDYPRLYHMWLMAKWQHEAKHTEINFDAKGKIQVTFSDDWS